MSISISLKRYPNITAIPNPDHQYQNSESVKIKAVYWIWGCDSVIRLPAQHTAGIP